VADDLERRVGDAGLHAAGALADPVRQALYELVERSDEPIGRDEAATAAGIARSTAGYHLDQLVAAGLLTVTHARRSGRSGPGAGRPAKLYQRAPVEVTYQTPPRDDALVAHLLATAVESDPSGAARDALRAATRAAGRELAASLAEPTESALLAELARRGYQPGPCSDGFRLRNCPFHHLVGDHLELVCTLNADLLGAAVTAVDVGLSAVLDPQPGRCCVALVADADAGDDPGERRARGA
jgi:predicted ArsR family transcriptional regulator